MKLTKGTIVDKPWGFEEIYVNSDKYCGKRLVIQIGGSTSIHAHIVKMETFTPILGNLNVDLYRQICLDYGDKQKISTEIIKTIQLKTGETLTLPPKTIHRLYPDQGDMVVLLEFSTNHDDKDTIRYSQ
jgi:D-lyxose ketol-isomerase